MLRHVPPDPMSGNDSTERDAGSDGRADGASERLDDVTDATGTSRRSVLGPAAGLGALLTDGAATADGTPGEGSGGDEPPGRGDESVELSFLGRYRSGVCDEGGAEIVAHDPATQRLFVVNANADAVDVIDVSDPADPTEVDTIGTSDAFADAGAANSVDVNGGRAAVAIANADPQTNGRVAVYDTDSLDPLGVAEVGALPDLVTFTPDGETIPTADEGEPSGYEAGDVNPEGSISVVDVSDGVSSFGRSVPDPPRARPSRGATRRRSGTGGGESGSAAVTDPCRERRRRGRHPNR